MFKDQSIDWLIITIIEMNIQIYVFTCNYNIFNKKTIFGVYDFCFKVISQITFFIIWEY